MIHIGMYHMAQNNLEYIRNFGLGSFIVKSQSEQFSWNYHIPTLQKQLVDLTGSFSCNFIFLQWA